MTHRLIADDLFAGAGGWDLAAEALGIHARGVENMPAARATRDAAGLATIHDDVWTYTPDGRATGEIASPPCPTFSNAGKGSGRQSLDSVMAAISDGAYLSLDQLRSYPVTDNDDRTRLVLTPLHFATGYEYEWLAWEQVPSVLPVWEACAEVLRAQGWFVVTAILNAEQFGVPQTRRRAKLMASRLGPVELPTPTHSRYYSRSPEKLDEGVQKWVSMAEALGWTDDGADVEWVMRSNYGTGGDSTKRGERLASEPAPTVTSKIDRNQWTLRTGVNTATVGPGAKRDELMAEGRWQECHKPQERSVDWHDRTLAPAGTSSTVVDPRPVSESSGTITGKGTAEWGERTERAPGPKQRDPKGVRVSVHEAGVLQSFPANYPWQGNKGKQYLQCGNAVPPLLALHSLSSAAVHHLAAEQIEGVA